LQKDVSPVTTAAVPNAVNTVFTSAVQLFSEQMLTQLRENYIRKGGREGWINDNPRDLVKELYYHTGKLQDAVASGFADGVREYSADVANLAMMVLDRVGGLLPINLNNNALP
jgi:hypothetical protein